MEQLEQFPFDLTRMRANKYCTHAIIQQINTGREHIIFDTLHINVHQIPDVIAKNIAEWIGLHAFMFNIAAKIVDMSVVLFRLSAIFHRATDLGEIENATLSRNSALECWKYSQCLHRSHSRQDARE